jgi:hypothetical protein
LVGVAQLAANDRVAASNRERIAVGLMTIAAIIPFAKSPLQAGQAPILV